MRLVPALLLVCRRAEDGCAVMLVCLVVKLLVTVHEVVELGRAGFTRLCRTFVGRRAAVLESPSLRE